MQEDIEGDMRGGTMSDKTIGCICTNDDPYECFRDRYLSHRGVLDEDEEKEACSCGCHIASCEEERDMDDFEYNLWTSTGRKIGHKALRVKNGELEYFDPHPEAKK